MKDFYTKLLNLIVESVFWEYIKEIAKKFIGKIFGRIKENLGKRILEELTSEDGLRRVRDLNLMLIKEDETTKRQVLINIKTID